jgi:hypothetical protein
MNRYKSHRALSIHFLGLDQLHYNLDFALIFHDHHNTGLALLKLTIHDCDKLCSLQESHRQRTTAGQAVNNISNKSGKRIY